VAAALDEDTVAGGVGHRCQHRRRSGDADGGAVIDDHQGQEAIEVARQQGGADREAERWQDETVGEAFGMVLHAGVTNRRGIHKPGDLPRHGLGSDPGGPQRHLSFA
jgi:hypothetical protein